MLNKGVRKWWSRGVRRRVSAWSCADARKLRALQSRREPDERTVSPAYGKRAAGIIALTYRSMNLFRWMSDEVDARVGFEVVTYPGERRFVV